MNTKDFFYELPKELIAQTPLKDRDQSRLLMLNKKNGDIRHGIFHDIVDELTANDVLVLNNTKVIPARLLGLKTPTNVKVELLLLNRISLDTWEVLSKPAKRLKVGSRVIFGKGELTGDILEEKEEGKRIVRFYFDGNFEAILDKLGTMPLPPYISEKLQDRDRYQTVYAKTEGSSAAPTAGLHFTPELLKEIQSKGVQIEYLTLHVGLGTFRPLKVDTVEEHIMHSEYFEISPDTLQRINQAKKAGKRIVSVGTTSVRTLESSVKDGFLSKENGWTDIFIYPPYQFQFVDAMITNFHLPESTLIMMISAFADKDLIFRTYQMAIENKYRFFSFGDAMMIY